MKYECIIIGCGASGLMLAANLDMTAAEHTNSGGQQPRGLILEKASRPGTKLLMSGGGRCNITHGGSIKDFIDAYGSNGPKLRKCLYRHNNIELAAWLEDSGISLADENGSPVNSYDLNEAGRIFPASMKSSDVLKLLESKSRQNGWGIKTESEVYDIKQLDNSWIVRTASVQYEAGYLVIATGGITYPETGSDGSMFGILKPLGVQITPLRSSLAPVSVSDYPYEELSGISIPDVTVTVLPGRAARMTGDLLFTHRGFSGPVILNISKYTESGSILSINYNKELSDLPRRLKRIIENRSRGPSGDIRTSVLAALLGSDEFTVSSVDEHGMVTSGGISLDCIDTSTMQIKGLPGLYAIGESIDADGITGGYNLQLCWSTARTVADSIRSSL